MMQICEPSKAYGNAIKAFLRSKVAETFTIFKVTVAGKSFAVIIDEATAKKYRLKLSQAVAVIDKNDEDIASYRITVQEYKNNKGVIAYKKMQTALRAEKAAKKASEEFLLLIGDADTVQGSERLTAKKNQE